MAKAAKVSTASIVLPRRKPFYRRAAENWQMYLFLLIPLVWLIIFKYWPMYGATIAFRKFRVRDGINGSEWVGLENFIKFFESYQFDRTVGNTLFLSIVSIVLTFPIPILFALLLNSVRSRRWKGIVENITYMPHFISAVVLVGILRRVFDINTGVINNLVELIPGMDYTLNMFMGGSSFRILYIGSGIWQETGWGSIIYMAALSSVDPQLLEAADMDGANRIQKIVHVNLPVLVPTIVILFILGCGSVLNVGYEKVYLLQNSLNLSASQVISTYVYEIGIRGGQFSYSSAIGLFNNIVNVVILGIVNAFAKKVSGTGIW